MNTSVSKTIVSKTIAIFRNGNNQAIRLPKEMQFEDITELEISKIGDVVTLRPVRKNWLSLLDLELADDDFLVERPDVIPNEGRFD